MAQNTAVDWLIDEIENRIGIKIKNISIGVKLIIEAKEMEKQQHENTWSAAIYKVHENVGHISRSMCDFDDYYNKTYLKD